MKDSIKTKTKPANDDAEDTAITLSPTLLTFLKAQYQEYTKDQKALAEEVIALLDSIQAMEVKMKLGGMTLEDQITSCDLLHSLDRAIRLYEDCINEKQQTRH